MFRKPVRTYERKKGVSHWLSPSSTSTIVREVMPPETKARQPENCKIIDNDEDSLDYDPFDTTFDRLAKDQIVHSIPQDQYSTSSYSDSSSDAIPSKSTIAEDDSLLDGPFMNPGLSVTKKRPKNEKPKRGEKKTTTTKKTMTRGAKRDKVRKTSNFTDENAVPNIEEASDVESGAGKRKNMSKKEAAPKKRLAEDRNVISNGKSIKRKNHENYRTLKRCSVRLKRLKISLDKSSAFENQESSIAEESNDFKEASEKEENEDRSAKSVESVAESTIFHPPGRNEKKKIEFLKNPVVSLSRLEIPEKRLALRHFSSSTPIGSKMTKIKSSLRLSPIKSNVDEDFDATSDTLLAGLPPKSIVRAIDSVSTSACSSLPEADEQEAKRAKKGSTEILSITPDPEPSGLMFDETEITDGKSVSPMVEKTLEKIDASEESPPKEFQGESSELDSLFRAYDDDGDSSAENHSDRIETMEFPSRASPLSDGNYIESMRNNTNDPFMGFTGERKDTSQKRNTSDKSNNTDDEWSTISESGNVTCDKSISEAGKIERLSSGENTSSEEIENFVDASEIADKRVSSIDEELFVDVDESKKSESDDGIDAATEEQSKEINLQEDRVLQPVVILSRLTIGKADDREPPINSFSETAEIISESNINVERIIDSPPRRSASIEPEFFTDTEESNAEMESLKVDDSKSFTDIESSPMRKESEKETSNAEFSLTDRENFAISTSADIQKEMIDETSGNNENLTAPESTEDEIASENAEMTEIRENNLSRENDRSSSIQPIVLLTRLNDPVRITRRRYKYRDWDLKLTAIAENTIDKVSSIVEEDATNEEAANAPRVEDKEEMTNVEKTDGIDENSRLSKQIALSQRSNDSCESSLATSQFNDSIRGDRVVFLRPGKSWARSLSILSQVHSQRDLESLAVGKGRKWRESVHNLLEMQQQGLIQSCVKKNENSKESTLFSGLRNSAAWIPGSSQPDTSRLFGLSSPGRFIRRISIRVVPDSKGFDNIKDTSFLEAYGITPTTEDQQTIAQRRTLIAPRKTLDIVPKVLSKEKSREVVLAQCGQQTSLPFDECYPESFLANCRKIGEGVYGEVFLHEKGSERSVIKIIPIEGDMKINSERQKKFDEILSEIVIAKALHDLRSAEKSATNSYVEVKNIRCVMGKYPQTLIDHWKVFDEEKNSENDCPSIFEEDQLYIVLELGHGGEDLEAYVFQNASEAHALFIQTALALAVAEESLEFEHRDLHWGNVLISRTSETQIDYKLKGKPISVASKGVKVSVIDFTLSRMAYQGCSIFNDLSMDDDLFAAQGEYQFDVYRLMRSKLENNWQKFDPFTNILWLHYILDKMITAVRYRKKSTKIHKNAISKLQELKNVILDYESAVDFVTNCDKATRLQESRSIISTVAKSV